MEISWWTLSLQAINFLILVWLLSRFLYRPVRRVIAERKALADKTLAEAEAKAREAAAAREQFEDERAELGERRRALEAEVHRQTQDEARRILDEARSEAAEIVAAAEAEAADERRRTLASVKQQVAGMAADLAAGLVRQNGGGAAGSAVMDSVASYIAALPEERLEDLKRDAAQASEPIEVTTAAVLPEPDRAAWSQALREWFGSGVAAGFTTDPDLLGGVRLRLPHSELDFTWSAQLREAEARIREESHDPRA